jgi:hypothetical protein
MSICCGQCLEKPNVPPCQNKLWGGHGHSKVASHQILCPYQLLKIVDVVLGHFFLPTKTQHLQGYGPLLELYTSLTKCASLGAHDTPCKIIGIKPKLVFDNLWVDTL